MYLVLNQFLSHKSYSLEEYFALEEKTGMRHEYYNGKLRPMSGGSLRHSQIAVNLYAYLYNFIEAEEKDCTVLNSDAKIVLPGLRKFLYADGMVYCGQPAQGMPNRNDSISNPQLIFEVLSPSTESYDLGDKFKLYQELKSLREYVIVRQSYCYVEVRTLVDTERNLWKFSYYESMNDSVKLDSLGIELPMQKIYNRIKFDESDDTELAETEN